MERLVESSGDNALKVTALENLRWLIKGATSSMTSVPKPMKHLRKYMDILRNLFRKEQLQQKDLIDLALTPKSQAVADSLVVTLSPPCLVLLADILSVMSMAYGQENQQDALYYKAQADLLRRENALPVQEISFWGHEYVRHISMELMAEMYAAASSEAAMDVEDGSKLRRPSLVPSIIRVLAVECLPFFLQHNAEPDAADLALELELLDDLGALIDRDNYERVALYLSQFLSYEADADIRALLLKFLMDLYERVGDHGKAFTMALRRRDMTKVWSLFSAVDTLKRRQFAFLLSRCGIHSLPEDFPFGAEQELLERILSNSWLGETFQYLATTEFKVGEPKVPEDVYKSHLLPQRAFPNATESLTLFSDALVNGLLNAGHQNEKLYGFKNGSPSSRQDTVMDPTLPSSLPTTPNAPLFKHREARLSAALASIGLVHRWDTDVNRLDAYLSSEDRHIQAGGLLALGIMFAGLHDPSEPVLALLGDALSSSSFASVKLHALLGLGIAYAGSCHPAARDQLLAYIVYAEEESALLVSLVAGISCALICVGSADGDVQSALLQLFLEVPESVFLANPSLTLLFILSFALLFLGVQDDSSSQPVATILMTIDIVPESIRKPLSLAIRTLSHIGTGNVLFIQECLAVLSENSTKASPSVEPEDKAPNAGESLLEANDAKLDDVKVDNTKPDSKPNTKDEARTLPFASLFALFGVALTPLGDDLSMAMTLRLLQHAAAHLPPLLKARVPLAVALLYTSHPTLPIIDLLAKSAHDPDMASNAAIALGLVGLGTNHAKISAVLRDLWKYHVGVSKDAHIIFAIKLALGMLSTAKGLFTASPLHHHRQLLHQPTIASLLLFVTGMAVDSSWWPNVFPSFFYILMPALHPRLLVTLSDSVFSDKSNSDTSLTDTKIDANRESADKSTSNLSCSLAITSVDVRVGQPMDVVGQAGRPKTISGFQTLSTPVLLAADERAEMAVLDEDDNAAALPFTDILEGFVLIRSRRQ
jgi:26S proteasome regulatory subunit N1